MGESRCRAERDRTITLVSATNPKLAEALLDADPWALPTPKAPPPDAATLAMLKEKYPGKRR